MDIEQRSTSSINLLPDSCSVVNLIAGQSNHESQVVQSKASLNSLEQADVRLMSDSCSDVDPIWSKYKYS